MPESPQAFDEQQLSNDGAYAFLPPYLVETTIVGSAPLLFHR